MRYHKPRNHPRQIVCPNDSVTNRIAAQLEKEKAMHPRTLLRNGYRDAMGQHECLGQFLLTFKHECKNINKIKLMLKQVHYYVSNKMYGRHAFNKDRVKNSAKWIAAVENNADGLRYHIHLLILMPDTEFIRPEFKKVRLNDICSFIQEKWIMLGGGTKGTHKYFESQNHFENMPNYLTKELNIDADHLLFDYAPMFRDNKKV